MANIYRRQRNVLRPSRKVSDIFCLILTKFGVYRQISKSFPVSNFKEIRPVGAAQIHADEQRDMKLMGALLYYTNVSKMAQFEILSSTKCGTFLHWYLYSSVGHTLTAVGVRGLFIFCVHIQVECRNQHTHNTSTWSLRMTWLHGQLQGINWSSGFGREKACK
jgi:hypothetical protein